MTRSASARMSLMFALALAAGAPAAWAADSEDDGTITATPAERAKTGDGATDDASLGEKVDDYLSKVHGEVGVAVGTNDMHAVYGTAVLPLGEESSLTLSFSQSRNAYAGYGSFYGSVFGPGAIYHGLPPRVR